MAELAALALRALGASSVPAQDAAREAGALPLVAALLNPAGIKAMAEERKARKDNAAAAASRAMHALAEGNTASKVNAFLSYHIHLLPHMNSHTASLLRPTAQWPRDNAASAATRAVHALAQDNSA